MKILIPIDFSDNSIKALEYAIGLAGPKKYSITLVHVVEMVYDFAAQTAVAIDGMHQDARESLIKLIHKYDHTNIDFHSKTLEGTPSILLAKLAEEEDADLIIMGTHGVSGIKKVMLGSTAVEVVKESTKPVLLVPVEGNITFTSKITLALEIANHEEPFIERVIKIAEFWNLDLEILHLQSKIDFKEKLSVLGLQAYLKEKFPKLISEVITIPTVEIGKGLDAYFKDNEDAILTMCHHHQTFWQQITSKSRSLEMAYHTKVPLLIML